MFVELTHRPWYACDESPDERICFNVNRISAIQEDVNHPDAFFVVVDGKSYRVEGNYESMKTLLQSSGESII